MERGGGGENDDERSAGDSGRALAADEQSKEHEGLLRDGEMNASSLGDENQRERLVKTGAIEIEAVAGGENKGYGLTGDTQRLHFFHGTGECSFRAGGGESNGDGLGGGAEELLNWDAGEKRDGKQNAGDEDDERNVHRGEQLQQMKKHAKSEVAYCVGYGTKDADRGS